MAAPPDFQSSPSLTAGKRRALGCLVPQLRNYIQASSPVFSIKTANIGLRLLGQKSDKCNLITPLHIAVASLDMSFGYETGCSVMEAKSSSSSSPSKGGWNNKHSQLREWTSEPLRNEGKQSISIQVGVPRQPRKQRQDFNYHILQSSSKRAKIPKVQ